jgi:uncharacterized protein (TIGR02453 family)
MAYFSTEFNDFFCALAANNHKEWFDENRKRYEQIVKKPFHEFVQVMIHRLGEKDERFKSITPAECIFRINRDIRFSKDKTPYKLFTSAVVAPQGKKTKAIGGIYFELGPEAVNIYGGVYEISNDNLYQLREGIAAHLSEFEHLISDPQFVAFFGQIEGATNKILAPEFKHAAAIQPLIYNKQLYFRKQISAAHVHSENLLETLVEAYELALPFHQFVSKFID